MQMGYDARIAGEAVDSCPLMVPDHRERWERGWNKIGINSFMLDAVVIDGVEMLTRVE